MANTRKTGSAARPTVRLSEQNGQAIAYFAELTGADTTTILRAGLEALQMLADMDNGGADRIGHFTRLAFEAVELDNEKGKAG